MFCWVRRRFEWKWGRKNDVYIDGERERARGERDNNGEVGAEPLLYFSLSYIQFWSFSTVLKHNMSNASVIIKK